ncbi:hypothetical protein D3C81_1540450 [compost metagenome]
MQQAAILGIDGGSKYHAVVRQGTTHHLTDLNAMHHQRLADVNAVALRRVQRYGQYARLLQ